MTTDRSATPARLALKGDLLDFTAAPQWGRVDDPAVRFRPGHWLLIDNGRIVGAQAEDPGEGWVREDHSGRLILPGFVDTHVHSPQLDVIASYGTELLDWLNTYTFPAERRWADPAVCAAGAATFLDALLAHGTTSAVVFPTVHAASADALFAAAQQRGMRVIAGQCLMDRHAPADLTVAVDRSEQDSEALRGNALGDPSVRANPLLLPAGGGAGLPLVTVLFGYTGFAHKVLNVPGIWQENLPERIARATAEGRISLGGGAPGVALTVDAAELVAALDATVADVTESAEEPA